MSSASSNRVIIGSDRLWVEFERRGDRFHHFIHFHLLDGSVAVLSSCESESEISWPTSPPLQSLHIEQCPGEIQTAMLVGMAGRSHWSLSVAADPTAHRLHFDVACRVKDQPQWLGSTYRWQNGSAEMSSHIDAVSPAVLQIDTPQLQLAICTPQSDGPLPRTIRWKYSVSHGGEPALAAP